MIFDASDDFQVSSIAYTMVGLIVFTIVFEKIVHTMKHKASPYSHYKEMLEKILAELTILGFLSFTLTILIQSGVLPHNEILLSFEFSHILIFFVACLLVIQGVNLAITSTSIKKKWASAKAMDRAQIAANYEKKMGGCLFFLSDDYENAQWWLLRKLFMQGQAASETGAKVLRIEKESGFDFGMYLETNLNFLVVDFVEIEDFTWAFLAAVGIAITGLYIKGYSIGHGDGVLEFCIVGFCGLGYTILLLLMAFNSTSCFLKLLGLPDIKYATLLDAFKRDQGLLAQSPHGNPITTEQFQKCFPMGSAKFFHIALDIGNMFNCVYCGLFFEHFAKRAYSEGQMHLMILMIVPSILSIFFIYPMIIKQYAFCRAVAALEQMTLSKTMAYMQEESALAERVQTSLRGALGFDTTSVWESRLKDMFARFDLDNSGTISTEEFRKGLSADPMDLDFTDMDFTKVMRVVDPDQGGELDFDEMKNFITAGQQLKPVKGKAAASSVAATNEALAVADDGSML
jgi:hypothetical protein